MKLHFIFVPLLAASLSIAEAQERAAQFDADAARATLSGQIEKKPGKFFTKSIGGDPVTKRFYTKDAVVVTRQSGATETHPFVEVPLLFRVNSDDLLDSASRANVAKVAAMLKDLAAQGAAFAIEGHASAEGDAQRNRELSNLRALRIQSLLREQGIDSGAITRTEGFGSEHAQFKNPSAASESELQQDRRVLVVKER